MRLFTISNIRCFQNLYRSFDNFDKPVHLDSKQKIIRPFPGFKMFLKPKSQKPVLYKKANALDRDQG